MDSILVVSRLHTAAVIQHLHCAMQWEFLGASEKDKCFQMKDKDVVCLVVYQQTDSQCTVRYADAEGGRPRLLLGLQVYFPASSGFTWEMMSEPSIRILTLRFRSLEREKEEVELASTVLMISTAYTTTYTTVQKFGVSKNFFFFFQQGHIKLLKYDSKAI